MTFNKKTVEKAGWEPLNIAAYCFQQILETAPLKKAAGKPFFSHSTNHPITMTKKYATVGETGKSFRLLYRDTPASAEQQKVLFIISVLIGYAVWRT